jgi:hypothetical protein
MVMGHNKVQYMNVFTRALQEPAKTVAISMCPEKYQIAPSPIYARCVGRDDTALHEADIEVDKVKTLIATDTLQFVEGPGINEVVGTQYVVLTNKVQDPMNKINHMKFVKFSCTGNTCTLINPSLFLAACSKL